jgi:hypothetical protein
MSQTNTHSARPLVTVGGTLGPAREIGSPDEIRPLALE